MRNPHPEAPPGQSHPKLTVVSQEIPYPPIHGGRVDMWRRLRAFRNSGVRVQLMCWSDLPPDKPARQALGGMCEAWLVFKLKQSWPARLRTLARILKAPSPVGSRELSAREHSDAWSAVRSFAPDAIWLDGLYGGELAMDLVQAFRAPLLTRSHNVEHLYWHDQYELSSGVAQRLKIIGRLLSLERFELSMLRASRYFYDISVDDLAYWRSRGLQNGRWLPPLAEENQCRIPGRLATHDIGFVGNLHMPNNVEAVRWLIQDVLPRVRRRLPGATALVAGSRPVPAVHDLIGRDPLTELRQDVSDAREVFGAARVLVNPMLHGSGVALKSIDMLTSGREIVSTSQGVKGLPQAVKNCFSVADDADHFAQAIIDILGGRCKDPVERNKAMSVFADTAIEVVLDDLRAICAAGQAIT